MIRLDVRMVIIGVVSGMFLAVQSRGGTVWDGSGTDSNINTPENWDGDACPAFDGTATVTFGAGGTAATINADAHFAGVVFSVDVDFTLASGAGKLSIGAGGVTAQAPGASARTYTIASGITLTTGQTWTVSNGSGGTTVKVPSIIADGTPKHKLTKAGNGTLQLAAANTFDGGIEIADGRILCQVDHAVGNRVNHLAIGANGTLQVTNSSYNTVIGLSGSGTIRGGWGAKGHGFALSPLSGATHYEFAGNILHDGQFSYTGYTNTQVLTLTGTNTGSQLIYNRGVLEVLRFGSANSADSGLGKGNNGLYVCGGNDYRFTIRYVGAGETSNRGILTVYNYRNVVFAIDASGSGPLVLSSTAANTFAFNAGTNPVTLAFKGANTGNNEVRAGITNKLDAVKNVVPVHVRKEGGGKWLLRGAHHYAGATTVAEGTLVLGSLSGAGQTVTVKGGGALGSGGTVARHVTVEAGGTLFAGTNTAAVGTFTIGGDLTLDAGARLNWDFGAAGTDRVVVQGTLNVAGGGEVYVSALGGSLPRPAVLIEAANISGVADGGRAAGWTVYGTPLPSAVSRSGNTLVLAPIPAGTVVSIM